MNHQHSLFTNLTKIILLVLATFIISACGQTQSDIPAPVDDQNPVATNTPSATADNTPTATPLTVAEPVNSPVSPIPTSAPVIAVPVILDEPIKVGDTTVSGSGPANVPLQLFEVAKTADFLGEVIVADDGTFSLSFDRPLRENERVAVTQGDLTDTPFSHSDFQPIAIREVPTYGYILADVHVQP